MRNAFDPVSTRASFVVDDRALVRMLQDRGARCVLLMLPEGVLHLYPSVARTVEKETGATVIVHGDEHWGGCDVPTDAFDTLGVDTIVSFGHTRFFADQAERVVFFPLTPTQSVSRDALPLLLADFVGRGFRRVCVSWSTEFESYAAPIVEWLHPHVEVLSPRGRSRVAPGQILGCDYSGLMRFEEAPDAHLIVADAFHATGSLLFLTQPVFWFNPYSAAVEDISSLRAPLLAQRHADIERARGATRFGILVERRPGQRRVEVALRLKRDLEQLGKEALLIFAADLGPAKLSRFLPDVEVFISTACPRLESFPSEGILVLNLREAQVVCGRLPLQAVYASSHLDDLAPPEEENR